MIFSFSSCHSNRQSTKKDDFCILSYVTIEKINNRLINDDFRLVNDSIVAIIKYEYVIKGDSFKVMPIYRKGKINKELLLQIEGIRMDMIGSSENNDTNKMVINVLIINHKKFNLDSNIHFKNLKNYLDSSNYIDNLQSFDYEKEFEINKWDLPPLPIKRFDKIRLDLL